MQKAKIGIVGLGFGRHMIENHILKGPGAPFFDLGAVCDADAARADDAAARYGVPAYRDLDALLADATVPVIGLFTGPVGRAGLLQRILAAGRDVMTTKPFETDAAAAAAVLAEAARLGRVLHLNSPCASLPDDLRQVEAWQKAYDLGRPLAARHQCWYKNVEKADGSWYDDPDRCPVAPILRLGVYGLNDMVRIFGEAETVQVAQSRLFTGRPTPDLAMMMIRFRNGALAETLDGWCLRPPRAEVSLTVYFEGGTVVREGVLDDRKQCCVRLSVIPGDHPDLMPAETVTLPRQQASDAYQWDVFYRAILGEAVPDATPPEVIVGTVKIIEAMARAAKSGRAEAVGA